VAELIYTVTRVGLFLGCNGLDFRSERRLCTDYTGRDDSVTWFRPPGGLTSAENEAIHAVVVRTDRLRHGVGDTGRPPAPVAMTRGRRRWETLLARPATSRRRHRHGMRNAMWPKWRQWHDVNSSGRRRPG